MSLSQSIHIPNNAIVVTVLQLFNIDAEFYRPVAESSGKVADTAEKQRKSSGYRRIVPDNLTIQEEAVIVYLEQHGNITTSQAEALLSLKERRAREILKEMASKELIEKCGSGRSTYYVRGKA